MGWKNIEKETIRLINKERARSNLAKVSYSRRLHKTVQAQAMYMSKNLGKISHLGPDGSRPKDRVREQRYSGKVEELCVSVPYKKGRSDKDTAELALKAVVGNVCGRWDKVGVGVHRTSDIYFVAVIFGRDSLSSKIGSMFRPSGGSSSSRSSKPKNRRSKRHRSGSRWTYIGQVVEHPHGTDADPQCPSWLHDASHIGSKRQPTEHDLVCESHRETHHAIYCKEGDFLYKTVVREVDLAGDYIEYRSLYKRKVTSKDKL